MFSTISSMSSLVRPLSSVSFHVHLQVVSTRKCFSTIVHMQKAFLQCVVTMWTFKLFGHENFFAQHLHLSALSPEITKTSQPPTRRQHWPLLHQPPGWPPHQPPCPAPHHLYDHYQLYDHLYNHHHIYKNKTIIDLLDQLLVDLFHHLGHLLVNYLIHHHIHDHLHLNLFDLTEVNFH